MPSLSSLPSVIVGLTLQHASLLPPTPSETHPSPSLSHSSSPLLVHHYYLPRPSECGYIACCRWGLRLIYRAILVWSLAELNALLFLLPISSAKCASASYKLSSSDFSPTVFRYLSFALGHSMYLGDRQPEKTSAVVAAASSFSSWSPASFLLNKLMFDVCL